MVSKGNAWWMTKTKGIYIYSSSPFRQRALAGFGEEVTSLARQHWPGVVYLTSLSLGAWYLIKWANLYFHQSNRKNPEYFNEEAKNLVNSEI